MPFPKTFNALPERDFVNLPAATKVDLKEGHDRFTASSTETPR